MENKKALFKLYIDCGRMGDLEGVFISTKEDVEKIIGKYIYWGEVLGKHSEVEGELEEHEVTFITDNEVAVEIFEKYGLESGYNPFDYIDEEYNEEEE